MAVAVAAAGLLAADGFTTARESLMLRAGADLDRTCVVRAISSGKEEA
jgi:hypothetical protein